MKTIKREWQKLPKKSMHNFGEFHTKSEEVQGTNLGFNSLSAFLYKKTGVKFTMILAMLIYLTFPVSAQLGNLNSLGKKVVKDTEKKVKTSQSDQSSNQSEAENQSTAAASNDQILYVSKETGSNKNDGSLASPLKNIDKAIELATPGAEIKVAGGIYMGTLNVGFIESDKAVKIYGSFDQNFEKQDIVAHPTLLQPTNESARSTRKCIMKFTKDVAGTVLDNLVFDGGERNAYSEKEGIIEGIEGGRLLPPTEKPSNANPTVGEPLLQFVSATTGGDVTIQNCVFTNGASFALQAGHRSGKFTVKNNVFVGNKMAAIEIFGTCASTGGPNTMALCGEVEVAYNTIIFTWSRVKDFLDMGYGVRIMTKLDYNIHNNIIGASILAGVDHTRFNKDEWVKIDNNIFFVNKDKDLHYSPTSNSRLRLDANEFDDLEFASTIGNKNEIPQGLKINKAYLDGYLNARYSEQTDLDRNSPANQWRSMMGMNLQGTMSSQVTMFCNKYPWKDALNLFGNVAGYGAQ